LEDEDNMPKEKKKAWQASEGCYVQLGRKKKGYWGGGAYHGRGTRVPSHLGGPRKKKEKQKTMTLEKWREERTKFK